MLFTQRSIIYSIILLTVLTACSGTPVDEKIYNHLEEAVVIEAEFEQQQAEIAELEKKEQSIFEEIITIEKQNLDEIEKLSEQAIGIIEERLDKVYAEKESIESAKEEFVKIEDLIDQLPDEDLIGKASDMYDSMIERYDLYEDLNKNYVQSLVLEEELYTLLPKEETEQEEVRSLIEEINESYTIVLELNDLFNENTTEYNALKKEFYKMADMNVNYKKD